MEFNTKYENQEVLVRIGNGELSLSEKFSNFFEEVLKNYYYIQGYIYSDADLKKLVKEKRPTFQSNLFRPVLNRLKGGGQDNMPGWDIYGITEDDH